MTHPGSDPIAIKALFASVLPKHTVVTTYPSSYGSNAVNRAREVYYDESTAFGTFLYLLTGCLGFLFVCLCGLDLRLLWGAFAACMIIVLMAICRVPCVTSSDDCYKVRINRNIVINEYIAMSSSHLLFAVERYNGESTTQTIPLDKIFLVTKLDSAVRVEQMLENGRRKAITMHPDDINELYFILMELRKLCFEIHPGLESQNKSNNLHLANRAV